MNTTHDCELSRYYAQRASQYDSIYEKPERQSELRQLETQIPKLLTGKRVLEIACGTGYWTQFIAHAAKEILATDYNPEPMAIARQRLTHQAHVRFMQADAYQLPNSIGQFDAVFAGFWWSHIARPDCARFLAGLKKQLQPGALIVLLDNRFVSGSSTPISHTDSAGNTYQRRNLADGSVHNILKNFPEESELHAICNPFTSAINYQQTNHYWLLVLNSLKVS